MCTQSEHLLEAVEDFLKNTYHSTIKLFAERLVILHMNSIIKELPRMQKYQEVSECLAAALANAPKYPLQGFEGLL